ncbi:hypothetical protein [Bacteroides thetaiotaomicron]|uniref:hypothetical protein n=1 Tax=Bacteroides thetaiotaomicron TaxID=818 RepID=UPI00233F6AAB|nr:hypothetical protein [Bacteroides thetaiotaomicron]MDC2248769.1 hypothetical protein [Bacteroides thetaiotaomicron]MDC2253832.1 hypothetical protein [Bacteroides thetaiotaomicron]
MRTFIFGYYDLDEWGMVNNASQLGVSMLPTDQAANLATLSSIYDTTGLKQRPATKEVVTEENVHYVTFLVSDGDNIAFNLWGNKDTWIMTCTVNSHSDIPFHLLCTIWLRLLYAGTMRIAKKAITL